MWGPHQGKYIVNFLLIGLVDAYRELNFFRRIRRIYLGKYQPGMILFISLEIKSQRLL